MIKWPFGRDIRLESKEVQLLHEILAELKRIRRHLCSPEVQSFTIVQSGDLYMPLALPDPGNTLQFTATPTPAGSSLPSGVVPLWASSDEANSPVTVDSTGLVATVVLSPSITVGEAVTLTISATLPDGTTPTGSVVFTVGSAPPPEVTGFSIAQTA